MVKEKIEMLVDGGKATPGPQLAQKVGPLGINITKIIESVNTKTATFKGMKIPVKILIDQKSKDFEIEVGAPSASELIKKEIKIEKGSGTPDKEKIGNLAIEQVIKLALMKKNSMLVKSLKAAVKNIVGSCDSIGVLVEGKKAVDINKEIDAGLYDEKINSHKTEITPEKEKELKTQLEEFNREIKKQLEKEKALAEKISEKKQAKEEPTKKEGEPVSEAKVPGKVEASKEATASVSKPEAKEAKKEGKK